MYHLVVKIAIQRALDPPEGLANAAKIAAESNCRMIIRTTLVPGYNDSEENITATAKFIKKIGLGEVNILPLHHLGSSKYELLGKEYSHHDTDIPNLEKMEYIKSIFDAYSIKCYLGSLTPF